MVKLFLTMTLLTTFIFSNHLSMRTNSLDVFIGQSEMTDSIVSFISIFDIKHATKDGYYLNEYIVYLDYKKAKEINGKKVRVTGAVDILKGIVNKPDENENKENSKMKQGRKGDTKYILKPLIEVLEQ